jgi:hypothetical protein
MPHETDAPEFLDRQDLAELLDMSTREIDQAMPHETDARQ